MKPLPRSGRLEGSAVVLVPLGEAEIEQLRQWRNADDVRIWFDHTDIIGPEMQRAWFDRYQQRDDDVMYVIRSGTPRVGVGALALYDIDRAVGRAEFGRLIIGERIARGSGAAFDASRTVCEWGFRDLGLGEIVLWVLRSNERAIRLYGRLGFHHAPAVSERPDHYFMSLRPGDLAPPLDGEAG